jgi:hypothetical protein
LQLLAQTNDTCVLEQRKFIYNYEEYENKILS